MKQNYFLLNCEQYGINWKKDHWVIGEFAKKLLNKKRWAMSYNNAQNGSRTGIIWEIAKKIKKGDVVFFYFDTKKIYAYGCVIDKRQYNDKLEIKDYEHDKYPSDGNEDSGFVHDTVFFIDPKDVWPHQLEVDYLRIANEPVDCPFKLESYATITKIEDKKHKDAREIMNKIDNQDFYANLVTVVNDFKNIIFSGAPGTGKTYIANEIAKRLTGEIADHIKFVQFHPSYDYSDFMEGLVPTKDAGKFEYREGIFKKFCREAAEKWNEEECKKTEIESRQKFVFIIDEINRGEVSKIFGEAFNSVEPSQRGNASFKVKTQYHDMAIEFYSKNIVDHEQDNDVFKDGFYVPENVFIIATMNDIDRSVEILDFAFRRRFPSWEITYIDTLDSICSLLVENNENQKDCINEIKGALKRLNKEISDDDYLGNDYCLGGAYLNNLPKVDFNKEKLWKYFLEPVLKEYLRGLSSQIRLEKLHKFKDKF